jgi:hypothetical protein
LEVFLTGIAIGASAYCLMRVHVLEQRVRHLSNQDDDALGKKIPASPKTCRAATPPTYVHASNDDEQRENEESSSSDDDDDDECPPPVEITSKDAGSESTKHDKS